MTDATKAAKAPKEPKAPKEVKPAAVEQNGVTQPADGTATRAVWTIADKLSAAAGAPAKRGDVLKAAEAAGLNPATAATQFGRWCKFNGVVPVPREKIVKAPKAPKEPKAPKTPKVKAQAPAAGAAAE